MPMIVEAPAMRAPCTALSPSGPQPTTATADPGASVASVPDVVAPRPATLTQLHTMPRSTLLAFDTTGHDPLFPRDHQLAEAADVRVGVDRRAVAQVGDRDEVRRQIASEQLADVGAAAQAVVARAALRRAGHAHAVAHLHAPHFRADGFHDADAAMALNQRHAVGARQRAADARRRWPARPRRSAAPPGCPSTTPTFE